MKPEPRGWLMPALVGVGLITALRVLLLAFNRTDLFVDEAQYWLWGQELAFGYYSKPPMIGWVIRASTDLAGSDAAFWVRLPAPLFHAVTSLVLGGIAARLFGRGPGIATALAFVTLPMVALGSLLISTDTIMFPFLALALAGYLACLGGAGLGVAALTGVALGLAFLSKYAAIYYVLCALLAALFVGEARLRGRSALVILAFFALAISPNIIWNVSNGLTTVQHTMDNADWVRDPGERAGLNFAGLAEFFFSQFGVLGPVLFGGLLAMTAAFRHRTPDQRILILFSLPIVATVCIQAMLSQAYANWAVSAYLAGTVAVVPWLWTRRVWLWASFAVNGALCLVLPLLTLDPQLRLGREQPLLERYIGRDEMSMAIIDAAREAGADAVVADNRDVLADLFYSGREAGLPIYAPAPQGRAPHHYAQKYPLPEEFDGNVLFVTGRAQLLSCDGARVVNRIEPESGAYRGDDQILILMPASCLR